MASEFMDDFFNKETVAEEPAADRAETAGADSADESLQDRVVRVLQTIYDPEIPVSLYELGLIYEVNVDENKNIHIVMTLTTPMCPVAESMPGEVEARVNEIEGIGDVTVELTWEPPWDPSKMSDEAKLELGLL